MCLLLPHALSIAYNFCLATLEACKHNAHSDLLSGSDPVPSVVVLQAKHHQKVAESVAVMMIRKYVLKMVGRLKPTLRQLVLRVNTN